MAVLESLEDVRGATEDGDWMIPTGIVKDTPSRVITTNEDRLREEHAGTFRSAAVPRIYYEDGTPVPYNREDVLSLLRQNPEERGSGTLVSRLIAHTLAAQTPEDRAPPEEAEDEFDMRAACQRDEDGDDSVSSFIYQDFLRRYMRSRTPERGIIVYHGLGSGKTATSIGMIESCLDSRRVIVILPASLKDNYRREVEKFAPALFGNGYLGGARFWRFREIPITDTAAVKEASNTLGIPEDIIRRNGGVYEVDEDDSNGGIPRQSMAAEERRKLDSQIVRALFSKITMYSSNGLASRQRKAGKRDNGTTTSRKEPKRIYAEDLDLDNAVIVCDEVHRIVSMRRNLSPVGVALYNKIRDAKNCRVVALSGTPIVNGPYEIAILANMLHGKQHLHIFPLRFSESRIPSQQTSEAVVRDVLMDPIVRFTQVRPSKRRGGGNELVVVRHPSGFRSVYNSEGEYAGVVYEPEWDGHGDHHDETGWRDEMATRLRARGILILESPSDVTTETAEWLPEDEELFLELYTTGNPRSAEGDDIINRREELSRRLLGKISYYRGADQRLLPTANPVQVVRVQMSEEQFGVYTRERSREIKLELNQMMKRPQGAQGRPQRSEDDFGARTITRPVCNMVLPESIERPTKSRIMKQLGESSVNSTKVNEAYTEESRRVLDSLREHPAFTEPDLELRSANLRRFSPKFHAMIENIQKTDGLVLIYSNLLHIEGLEGAGVFLEKMGYAPLTLTYDVGDTRGGVVRQRIRQKKASSEGRTDEEAMVRIEGLLRTEEDPAARDAYIRAPKYMIYSGETNEDIRSMLVSIFRGEVSRLPRRLREDVMALLGDSGAKGDGTDNLYGQIAKVLMITSAGAEGLNLRGVRQVHIVEPYWNRAREEQVFGRAVRICSHALLPADQRTVDRYIYVTTFAEGQLATSDTDELVTWDEGKTTDEYIYDLASQKQKVVDAFLRLMRSVAVDCPLNARKNDMLPTECYVAPTGDLRELAIPSYTEDRDDLHIVKSRRLTGLIDIEATLVYKDKDGVEHPRGSVVVVYDPDTRIAYEMDPLLAGYVDPIGEMMTSSDGVDRVVLYRDIYSDEEDEPVVPHRTATPPPPSPETRGPLPTAATTVTADGPYVFVEEEYRLDLTPAQYEAAMDEMMEAVFWKLIPRCLNTAGFAIFVVGHPGAGKSSQWPSVIREERRRLEQGGVGGIDGEWVGNLPKEDEFVKIDPDAILNLNPFYLTHLIERTQNPRADGKVVINPNVVNNRTIRRMVRDGVDQLFQMCLKYKISFVYESLFQDYEWYKENVITPTSERFENVLLYVFYNKDIDQVLERVRTRGAKTGRYVGEEFVRREWERARERFETRKDSTGNVVLPEFVETLKGETGQDPSSLYTKLEVIKTHTATSSTA